MQVTNLPHLKILHYYYAVAMTATEPVQYIISHPTILLYYTNAYSILNRLYARYALRITYVIVHNRDIRRKDQWSAHEPILRRYAQSVQAVATTSGLWLAYDHRRLVMASGHKGLIDAEATNALGVAVDRHCDRLAGTFGVRSAQPPELWRWRVVQS